MKSPLRDTQFVRFIAVGATNTAVDFGMFFVLASLFDVYFLIANFISTTLALLTSFALNSKFTFKKLVGAKGLVLFLLVTLAGIWLVQPIVIFSSEFVLSATFPVIDQDLILLGCKVLASGVSLVWNFLLYKKVVYAA